MSSSDTTRLAGFSHGLEALVATVTPGIAAVKALANRVSTGVCIAPNLLAVADHATKREDRIPIVLSDRKELTGSLLGRAPSLDLAIIKVENANFTTLPAADPASLKAGALTALVGLTVDVGPSVSLGILGAVGGKRRTWRNGMLDQFIRLDVNLYPSQIGAAVVNMEGHLIGLATPALLRHSALAIPIATIQRLAGELQKEGRIRHGYLGVGVQPVALPDALRTKIGLESHAGLMLLSVEAESPAEKAGLQLGDILVLLGTQMVADIEELQEALQGAAIGNSLPAMLLRGGEPVHVTITIAERPSPKKREGERH